MKQKTSSNIQLLHGNLDSHSVEVEPTDGNDVKIISIQPAIPENIHQTLKSPTKGNLTSALIENKGRVVQLNLSLGKALHCIIKNVFVDTNEDGSVSEGGMVLVERGSHAEAL